MKTSVLVIVKTGGGGNIVVANLDGVFFVTGLHGNDCAYGRRSF